MLYASSGRLEECTHDPPGGVGKANEFSNDGRWNRPRESDNWDADKVENPECTESFGVFVIGRYFVYFGRKPGS